MPGPAQQVRPIMYAARRDSIAAAVAVAAGLLLMVTLGMTTGFCMGIHGVTWPHCVKYLASLVTWPQWLALVVWAAISGILAAYGVRRRAFRFPLALTTVIAGAFIPVGLLLLARALNHVWPGTAGPLDQPIMTLLLLAYALVIPWVLGRAINRLPWICAL